MRCGRVGGTCTLALTALVLGLAAVREEGSVVAEETGPSVEGKKLIRWGWDIPGTELVRRNIRRMERTGFDGIAIRFYAHMPDENGNTKKMEMDNNWINYRPHKKAHFRAEIGNLKATEFRRFTDNFIFMNANAGGGSAFWFEDEHVATLQRNLSLAARICRETGLKGFLIDTEGYGSWTQLNSRYLIETKKMTIDEARARVREVMTEAARRVSRIFPEITVLIIYTGYRDKDQKGPYPVLAGAFTDGWLAGLGPKARVFDMREQAYGCKTTADFQEIAAPVPGEAKNSHFPDLRRERLKLGFGVWLDNRARPGEYGGWYEDPRMNHFTPAELSDALYYGLALSDGYVWVYGERGFLWPGAQSCKNWDEVNVGEAYLRAVATAKRPRPLAHPLNLRGADKEPLPPPAASIAGYNGMFKDAAAREQFDFVTDIDEGWEIWLDPGARGFDDRTAVFKVKEEEYPDAPRPDWKPIRVGEFWERQGYRYNGLAWYRVSFVVPKELEGKEVWLIFGGVADFCRIFFEGRGGLCWRPGNIPLPVEKQEGPRLNITELVDCGEENTMLMWVNNIQGPGGIWKPVKLAVTKKETGK